MNFIRLTIRHFREIGRDHGVVIVICTLLHLVTNAAFASFAVFAARLLYFGPGGDLQAFGLMCNAPLTASMSVLITTVALEEKTHHKVIDHHFFYNWLIVTVLFAWANAYAWFTSESLSWRFSYGVIHYPPLTDWLNLEGIYRRIPLAINVAITAVASITVPIVVLRKQPFRNAAFTAIALVATAIAFFLMLDRFYRQFIDDLDLYQNWLTFPGYNPVALSSDQFLVELMALPVSLPAWIVTTLIAAAAVRAALEMNNPETMKA